MLRILAVMDASDLRAQFPVLERLTYLNAGTDGPVPAPASAATRAELQRAEQEGRFAAHFQRRRELGDALRSRYAQLLGAPPGDVALTTSTSDGVAAVIAGFPLVPGGEILTSSDEHPGLLGPLRAARDAGRATVRQVPFERLAEEVGPSTRLIACSHVSWVDGRLAPAELAHVGVPVLLDGAQGLGAVPVDVTALGCAAYAASGQKWLCGPDGIGCLYVSPALRERLSPARMAYGGFADTSAGLDGPLHDDCRPFDTPALSAEAQAFALASLDVLEQAGWDAVHERATGLAARLADELAARGFAVSPRGRTTLVSWHSDAAEADRDRLGAEQIVVRNLPPRPLLRASVGAWNDDSDLERLLAVVGRP